MTEKFNDGIGGYTCDSCGALLWEGLDGVAIPSARLYRYSETKDSIVKIDGKFYCKACGDETPRTGDTSDFS